VLRSVRTRDAEIAVHPDERRAYLDRIENQK